MALLVGGTMCALALMAAVAPTMMAELTADNIVVRALGVTVGFAGLLLAYVAIRAASGVRRGVALLIAMLHLALAVLLLVKPDVASQLYRSGMAIFVPWMLGIPGMLALVLSSWRIR